MNIKALILSLLLLALHIGCDRAEVELEDEATGVDTEEAHVEAEEAPADLEPDNTLSLGNLPFKATGPIALVNGQEIEAERFNREARRLARLGERVPITSLESFRDQMVSRLVDEYLIDNALAEESIELSDEEREAEFARYKENFLTEDGLEDFYLKSGTDEETVRSSLERAARMRKMIKRLYGERITEAQAREFYESNISRFRIPEKVRASHILLRVERDAEQELVQERRREAQRLVAQLREGADFSQLARAHSQGPTASQGGDLGVFDRLRMVPRFSETAFALQPGEISNPVLTDTGFHIIKVHERFDEQTRSFDDSREEIIAELEARHYREAVHRFLSDVKRTSKVELKPENIQANKLFGSRNDENPKVGFPPIDARPTKGK